MNDYEIRWLPRDKTLIVRLQWSLFLQRLDQTLVFDSLSDRLSSLVPKQRWLGICQDPLLFYAVDPSNFPENRLEGLLGQVQ